MIDPSPLTAALATGILVFVGLVVVGTLMRLLLDEALAPTPVVARDRRAPSSPPLQPMPDLRALPRVAPRLRLRGTRLRVGCPTSISRARTAAK